MTPGRATLGALAAVAVLAACGREDGDERAVPAPAERRAVLPRDPALCSRARVRVTGRVDAAAGAELSGLAQSRAHPGTLWAVNDSGNAAALHALSPRGRVLGSHAVPGAQNVDWEGLAVAGGAVLIADVGDNDAVRETVTVLRVPEPAPAGAAPTGPARPLVLRYPDGAHDAETLLADPRSDALLVVTKTFSGHAGVYAVRRSAASPATLRRVATLDLGAGQAATAGDVSGDGRVVVIRSYLRAFAWRRRAGEPVAAALRRPPCTVRRALASEGQAETLALTRAGDAFFTVPEGGQPPLRLYSSG